MTADDEAFDVTADGETFDVAADDEAINVGQWERVASTVVGGTLIAVGLRRRSIGGAVEALVGGVLVSRGYSGHSRLYQGLGLSGGSGRERREPGASADAMDVKRTITIEADPEELHQFWRDPEQLARIMAHFADVTPGSGDRHRWTVHGPLDRSVSWETEIVEDRPGERIRWESLEGAAVPNDGSVNFRPAPGDRGTEVTLRVDFDPPGGDLGDAVMDRLDVVPATIVQRALRRFKSLVEAGEIPTLEKNPSARGSGDLV